MISCGGSLLSSTLSGPWYSSYLLWSSSAACRERQRSSTRECRRMRSVMMLSLIWRSWKLWWGDMFSSFLVKVFWRDSPSPWQPTLSPVKQTESGDCLTIEMINLKLQCPNWLIYFLLDRLEIKDWFTARAKELEAMNYTEKSVKRIILAAIRYVWKFDLI